MTLVSVSGSSQRDHRFRYRRSWDGGQS